MEKREELYKGKAKSIYTTDDANKVIMHFRNDTSAFDGKKLAQLDRKGEINNLFNAQVMEKLASSGIPTHFEALLSKQDSLVKNMKMLPVECVVRNIAAGSICRRLGIQEGQKLVPPTFEFFYKDDALGDPMINDSHIASFQWATEDQVTQMKSLTLQVNDILKQWFDEADLLLVDYKLEFGVFDEQVLLGDEFSPDGCRVWDKHTKEKLDKDRFRQDLGHVVESYERLGKRLGMSF